MHASRLLLTFFGLTLLMSVGKKSTDYSKYLPGVVKVTDYLYYDETEITNFYWLEYLHHVKTTYGDNSPEYIAAYPDTNVWINPSSYNKPYVRYYLKHEAYRDYPVVGISWKQANAYCEWRTARVREVLEEKGDLDKAPLYFNYRLPTYKEWSRVYEDVSKLENVIGEEGKRAYRGMSRFNLKRNGQDNMGVAGELNDNADITAPAKSYWPNQYGIYNIKGNVHEWLLEKNSFVGGAWNFDQTKDVSVLQKLDGTSAAVGFRCVCEVAEEAP